MSMTATTRTVHYFSLELTDVGVIVCGRHGLAITVYLLAVMDMFCGRQPVIVCGRH